MSHGFNIFRKLENGEIVQVAWRPDRLAAETLVHDLATQFPGEYGIDEAVSRPHRVSPSLTRNLWQN